LIQNEKDLKIKALRSDHRGEFQNEKFETFCEENGINHNFSAPRLLNKMDLWKGKIDLLRNWQEQC